MSKYELFEVSKEKVSHEKNMLAPHLCFIMKASWMRLF